MKVNGKHYRTIWSDEADATKICMIDQRWLPHKFVIETISSVAETVTAIKEMHVRGAGLIGATAGYGMYLAALEAARQNNFEEYILHAAYLLKTARPTAINPEFAVNRQLNAMAKETTIEQKIVVAKQTAITIANEDAACCKKIGGYGLQLIEEIAMHKNGQPVNILTHCNAGWLAFVDYGSATAPIYEAFEKGIPIHIWVDETRPRNQGASLTAWELENHGVPYTIITDNAGGHLMQHGMVDLIITGADRVTRCGDAANKIGTYLKALSAKDNNVPFYVALPSSTFDWSICDGIKEIPIEQRNADEVKYVYGLFENEIKKVLITPLNSNTANYGFDVTPAKLITGLITERGICKANEQSIAELFPTRE